MGRLEQRGERRRFGLPAAERPLMLLHHGGEKGRDEARRSCRGRERHHGADGVLLMRHGRGAAAPLAGGFGGFPDLGLRQQGKIARDLAERYR